MNTGSELGAKHLSMLGLYSFQRFRRYGNLDHLVEATEHSALALALTPEGHPDLPDRLAALGTCYGDRYRVLGQLADLEKGIECSSRAVALIPDGHPAMARELANLGVTYTHRYQHLGELADLEKSIECNLRAVALTPDDHPNLSRRVASLGVSYSDRFRHLGEFADLERSIEYRSRALQLTPDGHPDMSRRFAGLGVSYIDRFKNLGQIEDLDTTIDYFHRALALTPDDHPDLPDRLADLGVPYTERYQRLGELADLEKSVEYKARAISLTPDDHSEKPRRLGDLGMSYYDRYQRMCEVPDLEKAIEYMSRGLALTSDGHSTTTHYYYNHGLACFMKYQLTSNLSELKTALDSFRSASQLLTGVPRDRCRYAVYWAEHASKHLALNPIEAYQTAIDILPQFIGLGATTNQRYLDLTRTGHLAVNAAFAAIISSDYSLALEWLEHARCVVWNQSLMLRSPLDQLHSSHPDLASRLQLVSKQLNEEGSDTQEFQPLASNLTTPERASQQRHRLATEYQSLLAQARQQPGFEDFLQPMKANDLARAARNGPIVIINCHTERCDALIILSGQNDIHHLPLPDFNEEKALSFHSKLDKSLRYRGISERGFRVLREGGDEDQTRNVLATLWRDIVKPILDHLEYTNDDSRGNLPHITWCLTGALSFLPLHAAGDYDQPQSRIFNYVISSYTPTLTALLTSTPSSLSNSCRVLAIGQANTPGRSRLFGTVEELASVKAHIGDKAQYSQLIDSQATTTAVIDAMEQHDWVHLACHAHQNVDDPTKSGFFLHDGTLDLASINRRSFKNKGLAFLSACQTATGEEILPDEAIHLASGMLMAGYPSVIATMWSVSDSDAPFVADKVYAQLVKDGKVGNGEAGKALHYAIAELRDKIGEKEFGRWVPYIHIGS